MKVLVLCCALLAMARVGFAVVSDQSGCAVNDITCMNFFNGTGDAPLHRMDHFYCGGFKEPRDDTPVQWSLAFQYPLLAYLDVARKRALFNTVAGYLDSDGTDLCITSYDSYYVGTFDETVLVRLYFTQGSSVSEEDFGNIYYENSVPYLNTRAINITAQYNTLIDSGSYTATPGGSMTRGPDPTLFAVLVSYQRGNARDIYSFNVTDTRLRRANNPNPVNYGLEAGDIVFLVIGCLLGLLVIAAVLLGYCIHPFFLS